jgi:hypothetical protein
VRWLSAALLILVVAGACACGGGGDKPASSLAQRPPGEIVRASAAAVKTVGAIHLAGKLTDKEDGAASFIVDAVGDRFRVRLTTEADGRIEFVLIDDAVYLKGDRRAIRGMLGSEAARLFADKWLRVPADQAGIARDLLDEFSPERLAYCLPLDLGTLKNLGTQQLDGREVVVVSDRGDKPGTAPGKLYVAAEGRPLPLRIEQTGPAKPGGKGDPRCDDPESESDVVSGDLRIAYGKSVTVTAPPDAVDLTEVAGSSGLKT